MRYERANVQRMSGYAPGEQPASRDVVKLNTNESPYPPSPRALEALASVSAEALRRYPDPRADGLRDAIAGVHGLSREHVLVTNGGDELLRLLITTFVEVGSPVGVTTPSYSLYPVLAEIHGSPVASVSLEDDFGLPEGLARGWNEAGARLGFIVDPHAPSGALVPLERVARLADAFRGVLVVDEAYVDFVDPERAHSLIELVRTRPNVVLLRTFSKGYGLAGLRCGYGLGAPGLIAPMLDKTKDSYNVDAVTQPVATAAILDQAYARETWARVRGDRATLTAELRSLGFEVPDSQTNFVLARIHARAHGVSAKSIYELLKARHLYVRWFDQDRLRDRLRITVGTADQNARLVAALRELLDA